MQHRSTILLGLMMSWCIIISGYQEYNNRFKVNPEGFISIPNVGVVFVAGSDVLKKLPNAYGKHAGGQWLQFNIRTGLTKVNITLGAIRSIRVTLLGEVKKPGTYTLPSLATVFNALYASGGPNKADRFRNIEVIRNNRVIDTLDVYDFLSKGDLSNNILLADQDIIRIPTYTKRVTLRGLLNVRVYMKWHKAKPCRILSAMRAALPIMLPLHLFLKCADYQYRRRIVDIPQMNMPTLYRKMPMCTP